MPQGTGFYTSKLFPLSKIFCALTTTTGSRSVTVTQALPGLCKDMVSDCFSSAAFDASVFQLDVEKLRCDETVAAIRLGAPVSTS